MNRIVCIYIAVFLCLVLQCTTQIAGGVSDETTNGKIMGLVRTTDGSAAAAAKVVLIPSGYVPLRDTQPLIRTVTDSKGAYSFENIKSGSYSVKAEYSADATNDIVFNVNIAEGSLQHDTLQLSKPGAITLVLPDSLRKSSILYIPGTDIGIFVTSEEQMITIPSVPEGYYPILRFTNRHEDSGNIIFNANINVLTGDTAFIFGSEPFFSKRMYINTSSTGAGTEMNAYDFPLLVRLDRNNFNFSQSGKRGRDLRFTKRDSTQLYYEIERWDSVAQKAEIWLKMDTIIANSSDQYVIMQWGSVTEQTTNNSAKVFDTAQGFQGVWHLATGANDITPDASINGYNGTVTNVLFETGHIGTAGKFNNLDSYITMQNSANGKLNFPEDGNYTVSAWVNSDSVTSNKIIVGKGDIQYYLRIHNLEWYYAEYNNLPAQNWEITSSPYSYNQWVYLTAVRTGTKQYLYVNGVCTDSTVRVMGGTGARDESSNVEIGRRVLPDGSPGLYFSGYIDEVRLCNRNYDPVWIKLAYESQKATSTVVLFKE